MENTNIIAFSILIKYIMRLKLLRRSFKIGLIILLGILFIPIIFAATCDRWLSESDVVIGLSCVDYYSTPTVCNNCTGTGHWELITGMTNGHFKGFYWNGAQWVEDSSIVSGLPDIGDQSAPTVCNNCTGTGHWELITGECYGAFYGFYWNGTQWVEDSSIVSGLPDIGDWPTPTVCNNCTGTGHWELITGEANGAFYGFYWNETQWVEDSSIVSGLPSVDGGDSTPTVCNNCTGTGHWELITGMYNGCFKGFYWNGTQWVEDSSIVSGLPDIGDQSAPTVCNNCTGTGHWELITGMYNGCFKGFKFIETYDGIVHITENATASSSEVGIGEDNTITAKAYSDCGLQYANISIYHSETEAWITNEGTFSQNSLSNIDDIQTANFLGYPIAYCNTTVKVKITFLDYKGAIATTETTYKQSPYIKSSGNTSIIATGLMSEVDGCNATINATNPGSTWFLARVGFIYRNITFKQCNYESTKAGNWKISNMSEYCTINVTTQTLSVGDTIRVQSSKNYNISSEGSYNYTIKWGSYLQNTSFSNNISEQRIYKNDTLYNHANENLTYNIIHYNKYLGTLITGGTFTGELSNNSNINLHSEWSGDWLSETWLKEQDISETSNLSKQYLKHRLNVSNTIDISFININWTFTPISGETLTTSTGLVNISANSYNDSEYAYGYGDWLSETWLKEQDISETSNLSKQYLKHRLNVSNSIDINFINVNWTFTPISGETLTTSTGLVNISANSYNDSEYAYGYGDWLSETIKQYTANITEAGGNAWIKRDINNTIDINFTNIQNIDREGWTCTKQIINISANQFIENVTICNKTNVITKQQSNNTIYNDTVVVDSYINAYYYVNGSNTDTINYSNILVQTTLPDWATNTSPYIFSINLNSGKTYNLTVNITGKPAVETGYTFTKTQVGGGEKNIYLGTVKVYDSAVSEKEIWYYIPKSRLLNYEGGVSKTYIVDDRTSGFSVQDTNTSVIIKIPTTFGSSSFEPGNHQIRITYWTAGQLPTGGGGGAPTITEYLKVEPETIYLNVTQPGNYTVKLNITWSGPTTTAKFDYSDELIPYIVSPKKFENIELENLTTISITFYINDTDLAQQVTTLIKRISGKISIKVTHMGAVYLRYVPVDISIYKGVPPPPPTAVCGNGVCEPGENWLNCPEDCGGERIIRGLVILVITGIIIMIVTRV